MTTIKIDGLFALVCNEDLYPRIFTSRKAAEATNVVLGGTYKVKQVFINDNAVSYE